MTNTQATRTERRDPIPFAVVVIVVLILINSVLGIAALFGYEIGPTGAGSAIVLDLFGTAGRYLSVVHVIAIAGALGLLRGFRWAWFLVMVLTGLALAFELIYWWDGIPQYVRMALWVFVALYLNQRDVRAIYERGSGRPEPITLGEGSGDSEPA